MDRTHQTTRVSFPSLEKGEKENSTPFFLGQGISADLDSDTARSTTHRF